MEIQLQDLIDKIKKDGVDVAETEALNIVNDAKAQAEKIVNDAKAQAEKIINDAKVEIDRMTKSSEEAIRQAGRNLLISFRESVTKELEAIVEASVSNIYSSSDFAKIIANVIETWANKQDAEDIAVILGEDDLRALEGTVLSLIKEKMIKGVTLKASDNFNGGFRIAVDNGKVYYDYSTEAVVNMLSNYLSPKVVALLKEAK